MRKLLTIVTIIAALLLVLGTAACGNGAAGQGAALTPNDILTKAIDAGKELKSAKGTFGLDVTMTPEAGAPATEGLPQGPVKISGTIASGENPTAAEITVKASMGAAGQDLDFGFKMIDKKVWIAMSGQWYETPPLPTETSDASATAALEQMDPAQILNTLGIDPQSWVKDLTLVGTEQVNGFEAYHLHMVPDVNKMVTDLFEALQSNMLKSLAGSAGSSSPLGDLSAMGGDMTEMQEQMTQMFSAVSADLWIDTASFAMVKVAVAAQLKPPAGTDADGVASVDLNALVQLTEINKPVTVEAPVGAKPASEFENAFQSTAGSLLMPSDSSTQ